MVDFETRDLILSLLNKGPQITVDMRTLFKKKGYIFSKQAFYKSLRKLLDEEAVIKQGQFISLSKQWILKKEKELTEIHVGYKTGSIAQATLSLHEGEHISYVVDSIKRLDLLLLENLHYVAEIAKPKIVFIWDAHEFFVLARPKQSELFLETMKKQKTLVVVAVEKPSALDKNYILPKMSRSDYCLFGMSCKNPFTSRTFSVNIIGSIVITVVLGSKTRDRIGRLYSQKYENAYEVDVEIAKILSLKDRHKITIQKNSELAKKLKRKISSDFVIPVGYREFLFTD